MIVYTQEQVKAAVEAARANPKYFKRLARAYSSVSTQELDKALKAWGIT